MSATIQVELDSMPDGYSYSRHLHTMQEGLLAFGEFLGVSDGSGMFSLETYEDEYRYPQYVLRNKIDPDTVLLHAIPVEPNHRVKNGRIEITRTFRHTQGYMNFHAWCLVPTVNPKLYQQLGKPAVDLTGGIGIKLFDPILDHSGHVRQFREIKLNFHPSSWAEYLTRPFPLTFDHYTHNDLQHVVWGIPPTAGEHETRMNTVRTENIIDGINKFLINTHWHNPETNTGLQLAPFAYKFRPWTTWDLFRDFTRKNMFTTDSPDDCKRVADTILNTAIFNTPVNDGKSPDLSV